MEFLGSKDVGMVEKLLKSGEWDIPDEVRSVLPAQMVEIVTDKYPVDYHDRAKAGRYKWSHSARLKATRVLLLMNQQNQSRNPATQKVEHTFSGNVHVQVEQLETLKDEELEKLAAAAEICDRIRAVNPN